MKRRLLIPFFFLCFLGISLAQAQIGREWIVSGQPYYKIPVAQEGVYKIPFSQLNSAGISTSNPDKLQLWFRGVEQSVLIDGTDFYFYGKGNDGTLDSLLYEPHSAQCNKYYSLFSDTTYYFITIGSADGKRLNANTATSAAVTSNHMNTHTIFYADEYSGGMLYSSETHLTPGDVGEGWVSSPISQGGPTPTLRTINVPVSNVYTGGSVDPELEIMLVGVNQNLHNVDILLGNPASPLATYSIPFFYQRNVYKFKQSFPVSYLTNNQPLPVTVRVKGSFNGVSYDPDMVALAYIILKYPQTTNLSGKNFHFIEPVNDNTAKTLNLTNFTNGSMLWDISNEGAFVNLNYNFNSGTATANVSATTRKILYSNDYKSVIDIKSVDMTPYSVGQSEMLLITHAKLLAGSDPAVLKYAQYRRDNGTSVTLTDVTKLYNLYTYGEKHPMAIKRYCQEEMSTGVPKYLFLVGKGINYNYFGLVDNGTAYYRKDPLAYINNNFTYQQLNYRMEDLVPAYGWPSSDLYYTITDITLRPKLVTGRLSARTDADVAQYLDKVKANDNAPVDAIWRKHLVHLSGGKNTSENLLFKNYMNGFKAIAEAPRFGGKVVRTYSKDPSVGAVDTKLIYSVADETNKGLSYITFFGHSSPSIIDLDIGNVSNPVYGYNNNGKYPLLFMNGCQSSEFFIQGSIPEDWIMTPNKGALMALGHGDIGYPQYMQKYTELFYKFNFNDNRFINSSIGEVQNKTIDSFLTVFNFDMNKEIVKAQATQFVLQGDPVLRIYKPQQTDYAIAGDAEVGEKKVFIKQFGNVPISAMADSFAIAIPITNYGLSDPQNLQIKVRHIVSNNNTQVIDRVYPIKLIGPIGYVDTIYFTIKGKDPNLLGSNRFEITVDPNDSIAEFNEYNNFATLEYFVPLSSLTCLFPTEYSVVHTQPVNFVAQSIDLLQTTKNYYVEIDTSHLYNSPAKVVRTISSGALVKFTESLFTDVLPSDSVVYYWRIRFEDLLPGADTLWGESSFIYIKESPDGWSQSEYPQFFKDTYDHIEISPQGELSFVTTKSKLYARTHSTDVNNQEIGLNNNSLLSFIPGGPNCGYMEGCLIVVFGAESALPYLVNPSYQCGVYLNPQVQRFGSLNSLASQNAVDAFLKTVKEDDFVLFMTTGASGADNWSAELKATLEDLYGAQHLALLGAQSPYILLSRHRAGTTPLQEIYSTTPGSEITMDYELEAQYSRGTITSTLIGPATLWGTMYKTVTRTNNDFAELKVIRINMEGKEVDTIGVALDGDVDLAPLVNADIFPYIKLMMYTVDNTDYTPAYLEKWQVIYSPAPEGTIDPFLAGVDKYTVSDKNLGETFTLPFGFVNISDKDFAEPLRVVFTLRNDRGGLKRDTITIGLLAKGQSIVFNYTVNIGTSVGRNVLQAYVNPKFQREIFYQNNIQEVSFNVQEDKTHPVVGAMFDGVHIFDGDIVSPSPVISVNLVDNNNLLTMNSETMTITLIDPKGTSYVVKPNDPSSSFIISRWEQDPTNKGKFRVEFKPKDDFENGRYKLIIQGTDASGNRSGNQNLEINFEVLNESTITNFYPYPNPFSTSCRFVFTLTGKEIPEDLKIQIMTVSGKVVREIFKHELGNIHVGDNVTDYAWDGRDEFGDKLANGVYIYRVIIKNKNDKFEHRNTAGDKAFKKGYGKLYILR